MHLHWIKEECMHKVHTHTFINAHQYTRTHSITSQPNGIACVCVDTKWEFTVFHSFRLVFFRSLPPQLVYMKLYYSYNRWFCQNQINWRRFSGFFIVFHALEAHSFTERHKRKHIIHSLCTKHFTHFDIKALVFLYHFFV